MTVNQRSHDRRRLERLQATLKQRLLVTNLVNIQLADGLRDVERGAARRSRRARPKLFTDFRYIEGAEAIPGVEAVLAKRSLMVDLAKRLRGKIGFEADILPWTQMQALGAGGLDLVPMTGTVEALRAVKDEEEIGMISPLGAGGRARIRGADGGDVDRAERAGARVAAADADARPRRRPPRVRHGASPPGRTARSRTASPTTRSSRRGCS